MALTIQTEKGIFDLPRDFSVEIENVAHIHRQGQPDDRIDVAGNRAQSFDGGLHPPAGYPQCSKAGRRGGGDRRGLPADRKTQYHLRVNGVGHRMQHRV